MFIVHQEIQDIDVSCHQKFCCTTRTILGAGRHKFRCLLRGVIWKYVYYEYSIAFEKENQVAHLVCLDKARRHMFAMGEGVLRESRRV